MRSLLANLSIKQRLYLLAGFVAGMYLIVSALLFIPVNRLLKSTTRLNKQAEYFTKLSEVHEQTSVLIRDVFQAVASADKEQFKSAQARLNILKSEVVGLAPYLPEDCKDNKPGNPICGVQNQIKEIDAPAQSIAEQLENGAAKAALEESAVLDVVFWDLTVLFKDAMAQLSREMEDTLISTSAGAQLGSDTPVGIQRMDFFRRLTESRQKQLELSRTIEQAVVYGKTDQSGLFDSQWNGMKFMLEDLITQTSQKNQKESLADAAISLNSVRDLSREIFTLLATGKKQEARAELEILGLYFHDITLTLKEINLEGSSFLAAQLGKFSGDTRWRLFFIIFTALAIILATTLFSFRLAQSVSVPITDLSVAAGQIAAGDLSVRVKAAGKNEISLLSQSFNSMVASIASKNQALLLAKSESDSILSSVNDGIFLIGRNLQLATQFSEATKIIFSESVIAGRTLNEILAKSLTKEKLKSLTSYLELGFKNSISEQMFIELNPIDKVEMTVQAAKDELQIKYLEFYFQRVLVDSNVEFLLGVVRDVTAETELSRRVIEAEDSLQKSRANFFSILHVDPKMLEMFIEDSLLEIENVEHAIELLNDSQSTALKPLLQEVFRSVHTVKGEAGILQLTIISEQAHVFEEHLQALLGKEALRLDELSQLSRFVYQLRTGIEEIFDFQEKIRRFQSGIETRVADPLAIFVTAVRKNMEKVLRSDQKVEIDTSGFDFKVVPRELRKIIKDIFVQLVRNSAVHGIESTEARKGAGKQEAGTISMSIQQGKDGIQLQYSDDGRGVNIRRLKEEALKMNRLTPAQADRMSDTEAVQLIFEPSVSTSVETSMHGGRGVGMDIVAKMVASAQGKMEVASVAGQSFSISVLFPQPVASNKGGPENF